MTTGTQVSVWRRSRNPGVYLYSARAQLEDKLKGLIDEDLQDKVSLQSERELFVG